MQKSDSLKVDSASLIDLKAELFRKQEEFRAQKLQSQNSGFIKGKHTISTKKSNLSSKKNAGVSQRAKKDYEEKEEEENVFERSRKALENKTKLYEQIARGSGISDEDGSKLYLVDFEKKSIDDFEERREKERREKDDIDRREFEEEQRQLAEPVPLPDTVEEEWVDYVDAFGRARRCLRKDLPDIQRQDGILQVIKRGKSEDILNSMSKEMIHEMERQKCEKEEMERMEEEKQGPIHYSDVQHNEIRTHGVGYYKFDREENVRKEQMEQLNKLRQETKNERSKSERIKEKRKAALAARLAVVKHRKRVKLGLPECDHEDVNSDEDIGVNVEEKGKKEPEPLTRDDRWRATVNSNRDWDKGKHFTMERSEEAWLEKLRADREKDFAPPSFYYESHSSNIDNKIIDSSSKVKELNENAKKDNEIEAVIEKQLIKIRNKNNLETSASSATNVFIGRDVAMSDEAENVDKRTLREQSSSLNFFQLTNIPSKFNKLSPNFGPPAYNAPPPNINFQPPNFSLPPPGYVQPAVASFLPDPILSQAPIQETSVTSVETNLSETSSFVISKQTQYIETQDTAKIKRKFVPKLSIIDTRLMGGEGD